jgi:gliding motility-associated-like protein
MNRIYIAIKILLISVLCTDIQAQTVIFTENFNAAPNWTLNTPGNSLIVGSLPNPGGSPNTWVINNTGTTIDGSNNLHITCSGFFCNILGAPGPIYNASGAANNTNSAATMNSDINASIFTGGGPYTLTFQWQCEGAANPNNGSARLIYSIDGGATWIEHPTNYNGNGGAPVTESIDMSTLLGFTPGTNNIRLGFRWFNIGTTGHVDPPMIVDNINIIVPSASNSITTGTVTGSPFCAGATFNLNFTSTGTFAAGNTYTAQLSDAAGSFASPVSVGSLNSTANSGTIAITIPSNTPTGSGYIIRIISSNPAITGSSSLAFTVNQPVTPTFNAIANVCQNATAPVLPTSSTNVPPITGTWSPAVSTTTVGTTVYTFTPTAGQCATTTTLNITVDPTVTPTFTAVANVCQNATAPVLPTSSTNVPPITGTWSPAVSTATAGTTVYTFTPTAGQCATTTTLNITVEPTVTPTFTAIGPLCLNASAPLLPLSSSNATPITGTWSPSTINTSVAGIVTYTFTPDAGQCATSATMDIEITNSITPTFAAIGPLCLGSIAPILPSSSSNLPAITGTWSPATINTANVGITTYTFTPDAGQCAGTTTLDIEITNSITPTFAAIGPFCQNSPTVLLPQSSNNLPIITGTWTPFISVNTSTVGTTTYTFTPDAGQCASTTTVDIEITAPNTTPTFSQIGPLCLNATAPVLLSSSNNTIPVTGTWSPAIINTNVAGITTYTFTPDGGQCAVSTTMDIEVTTAITPTFASIGPLCVGSTAPILPSSSSNIPAITGTWSPANINTASIGSFTFNFTADPNQCAANTSIIIDVTNSITPTFAAIAPLCEGVIAPVLPLSSTNTPAITGSWNPATINTLTTGITTYTFTPDAGQCGAFATLDVEVIPAPPTPSISIIASTTTICAGQSVDFTATPNSTNTGDVIQWFLNGNPIVGGTGLLFSSNALNNNDQITAVFTPASSCLAGQTATSNLIIITVNPAVVPTISINATSTQICAGDNVTFNANITGGGTNPQVQWLINGNAVAGATANSFSTTSLSNSDIVTAQLTSNLVCASPNTASSNSLTMSVLPFGTPSISIAADRTVICVGQEVILNAITDFGGSAPQYSWQIGSSSFTTTTSTFTATGLSSSSAITCTLISNYACVTANNIVSNTVNVQVNPVPTVSLSEDVTIQEGETTNLTASANAGLTYLWTPSATLTCSDCLLPTASPIETTVYTFTVSDPATSCSTSDSLKVTVIRNYDIWVPSAFSPNEDGSNDFFFVRGNNVKEFTITLYDRWGTKVYETSNLAEGWNGEYQNRKINSGVLVYVLTYTLNDGTTATNKGNITVSN